MTYLVTLFYRKLQIFKKSPKLTIFCILMNFATFSLIFKHCALVKISSISRLYCSSIFFSMNVVVLLSFFLVFYSVRVNWRLFHAPQTKVILSKPDMGWLELQRSKKPGIFTQDALGSLLWPSVDMRSNLITSGILRWFLAGIFLTLCSPKNSYVTYVMFCWLI